MCDISPPFFQAEKFNQQKSPQVHSYNGLDLPELTDTVNVHEPAPREGLDWCRYEVAGTDKQFTCRVRCSS